jgi:hypothetical protein
MLPSMDKHKHHPMRAETTALGYEGVRKKYGNYCAAARQLGITTQTLYAWCPVPEAAKTWHPRRDPTGPDPAYPDLAPRAAIYLRKIIELTRQSGGKPPTLRDLGAACGARSTNGVNDHIKVLTHHGYIEKAGGRYKSCGYRLTDKAVPPLPREDIEKMADIIMYYEDPTSPHYHRASRVLDWLKATLP